MGKQINNNELPLPIFIVNIKKQQHFLAVLFLVQLKT